MPLIDVVNLNADASCLSSSKWLRCLEGGAESTLARLLRAYVQYDRKVNLGITGATVKDIAAYNPHAIDLINANPGVFEIVLRPFAHDNALLRLPNGFRYNVECGFRVLRETFLHVGTFYLAPEIMTTGEQIHILHQMGVTGVFLHKGRYDVSVSRHVPDHPFELYGIFNTAMLCVPFAHRELESKYLRALHGTLTPSEWAAEAGSAASDGEVTIWRDGESALLHPLEPQHEAAMLAAEKAAGVDRRFLSQMEPPGGASGLTDGVLRYFPLHSLKPWLDTMKLYWYVDRVQRIEQTLGSLPEPLRPFWLLTINSDILSAAEKRPPVVEVHQDVIRADRADFLWEGVIALPETSQVILTRSERAGEGEDYLAYLELLVSGNTTPSQIRAKWRDAREPHLRKALARVSD